jgi:photosystem I subunit 9
VINSIAKVENRLTYKPFLGEISMQYFVKYLTLAPVLMAGWLTITAGILIEFNRFFPDLLFHPMP